MKFRLLVACALVLVAGCSGGNDAGAGASAQAPEAKATAPTVVVGNAPVSTDMLAYSRLPEPALRFSFPFEFKSDKAVASAKGNVRGTMVLTYHDTPIEQIWTGLDVSFQKAGYRVKAYKADGHDRARRQYVKKGSRAVLVTVAPVAGSENGGTIWLSWEVAKLAKPKAPVAAG